MRVRSGPNRRLLLGVATHAGKKVIFKVAKWDPTKHPRGYKGMFIDTPDEAKVHATQAGVGDVVVTKSGKVFKVAKQTEKGVKVNPVDPDSGTVNEGSYTVLGNEVQVGLFESSVPVGQKVKISTLEPGTFVQHPNSGKRWVIGKHGKWTTVWPVDDAGNKTGKHTVLPPDTDVLVSAPAVTDQATVKQAVIFAKDKTPDYVVRAARRTWVTQQLNEWFADELDDDLLAEEGMEDIDRLVDWLEFEPDDPEATGAVGSWFKSYTEDDAKISKLLNGLKDGREAQDDKARTEWAEKAAKQQPVPPELPEERMKKWLHQNGLAPEIVDSMVEGSDTGWPQDGFEWANLADTAYNKDFGKSPDKEWLDQVSSYADDVYAQYAKDKKDYAELYEMWQQAKGDKPKGEFKPDEKLLRRAMMRSVVDYLEENIWGEMDPDDPNQIPDTWVKIARDQMKNDPYIGLHGDVGKAMSAWVAKPYSEGGIGYKILNSNQISAIEALGQKAYEDELKRQEFAPQIEMPEEPVIPPAPSFDPVTDLPDLLKEVVKETLEATGVSHAKPVKHGLDAIDLDSQALRISRLWTNEPVKGQAGRAEAERAARWIGETVAKALEVDYSPPYMDSDLHHFRDEFTKRARAVAKAKKRERAEWEANKDKLKKDYQTKLQAAMRMAAVAEQGEVMPKDLPKPPKKYPPGVGKDTVIVVEEFDRPGVHIFHGEPGQQAVTGYVKRRIRVKRVPKDDLDAAGQVVGWETQVNRALALARSQPAHEGIIRRSTTIDTEALKQSDLFEGHKPEHVYVDTYGVAFRIEDLEQHEVTNDSDQKKYISGQGYLEPGQTVTYYEGITVPLNAHLKDAPGHAQTPKRVMPHRFIARLESDDPAVQQVEKDIKEGKIPMITDKFAVHTAMSGGNAAGTGKGAHMPGTWLERHYRERKAIGREKADKKVRGPRPERFIPELRQEWDMDTLKGADPNTAIKHLSRLGYREIKPRQAGNPKMVNAAGRRIHMKVEDGKVVGLDEIKPQYKGQSEPARDFHKRLQEALDTKADISLLDPRDAPDPEIRNSITHQILYDMALGHVKGVENKPPPGTKTKKVKTDKQYFDEIEKEGLFPLKDFESQVPEGELTIKARGVTIERFGMKDHEGWDFPNRRLTVPPDFSANETYALQAIALHIGVADAMKGESTLGMDKATFSEAMKVGDDANIYDAAKKLATFMDKTTKITDKPEGLDDGTLMHINKVMEPSVVSVQEASASRVSERARKIANLQRVALQKEADKRRAKEGTVRTAAEAGEGADASKAHFTVPLWEDVEMEPQHLSDVEQLVSNIGDRHIDVPVFVTGGLIEDGIVQIGTGQAYAKATFDSDALVRERLELAGAEHVTNSQDLGKWFGYTGSGKLYPGDMLLLEDASTNADTDAVLTSKVIHTLAEGLSKAGYGEASGQQYKQISELSKKIQEEDMDLMEVVGEVNGMLDGWVQNNSLGENTTVVVEDVLRPQASAVLLNTSKKRVEYVPHEQAGDLKPDSQNLTTGAPTSQRGQIRLYGYTPEEAIEQLKELGIVHELEPEVPFDSIMRSDRRYGRVAPLHPAYVRGDADPPKISKAITHGITGGAADLENVLRVGALLPISERIRFNLKAKSKTSPAGDVRSGIDGGIFASIGQSHWGQIKFVFKDDVYMRRDIIVSPRDYGAGPSRYKSYYSHANKLRLAAGDDANQSLYEPLSPAARQVHINQHASGGSNEFNPVPGVALEDIATIVVPSEADREKAQNILNSLVQEGFVTEVPAVVTKHPPIGRT